jgi:hypothetical protein
MKGFKLADTAFLKNNGFTPANISGLWRWYKADYYTSLGAMPGDSIGGGGATWGPWLEETGSGDDANNAAGGGLYFPNVFGTGAVIRNDNGFLNFTPGNLVDFTAVVVYQMRTSGGAVQEAFLFYNNVTGHQLRTRFFGSNDVVWYNVASLVSDPTFVTPLGVEAIACRRSGGTLVLKENDVLRSTNAVGVGAWGLNQIGNSALGAHMDFAEIMIWNVAVSDANLTRLYNEYLKPKYSPLP